MPISMEYHPGRWLILSVVCLSTMSLVIDNMALAVAVPPLAEDLKASAQNIQQMGAALGVAILGSFLASAFTRSMPGPAPDEARRSIGDALPAAARTGDAGLAEAARDAFASAMSISLMAGACGVLAAAVLAFLVMRDRKIDTADPSPVQEKTAVGANP